MSEDTEAILARRQALLAKLEKEVAEAATAGELDDTALDDVVGGGVLGPTACLAVGIGGTQPSLPRVCLSIKPTGPQICLAVGLTEESEGPLPTISLTVKDS